MYYSSNTTIAVPPGATIKEQLEDRSMTQKEFSLRMGMSEKHISNLINGKVVLTPDAALRLESVLGVPAKFWNNLEASYRERIARVDEELAMEEDEKITANMPYSEMAKRGWVKKTRIMSEKVLELRKFFEVARLSNLDNANICIAYRRARTLNKNDYSALAWVQKVRQNAREIRLDTRINIKQLEELIPMIRKLTCLKPDEFCGELVDTLAQCGVVLIFLNHIRGSGLHGASFVDGNRIVIGISVRGKYADVFWFSLMHEIAHIICGHVYSMELTPENENEADAYARNALIPKGEFEKFTAGALNAGSLDQRTIRSFAQQIGVDEGIVVGRLQNDKLIQHNQFNNLRTKYEISE